MINFIELIQASIIDAISGLIKNSIYIILVYLGGKRLIKEIPKWLSDFHRYQMEELVTRRALEKR